MFSTLYCLYADKNLCPVISSELYYIIKVEKFHTLIPLQVNAAGDLCAICQEKMNAPILLRCKHIFCEDCVSEW